MSKPLLSVITINFNNKSGLESTIMSVIGQTWTGYEFIVVDAGSTDGSRDVIEKYKDKLSWWCSEPDGGVYAGMNKGVRHAKGDYCIFMNSGDTFFDSRVLEDVYNLTRTEDIISGREISRTTGEYMHVMRDKTMLEHIMRHSLSHQATFIKRELLIKYPYDEHLKIVSDWKFWIEAILIHNCSFTYIDRVVALYDETGISSTHYRQNLYERVNVAVSLLPQFQRGVDRQIIVQIFSDRLIGEILTCVRNADEAGLKEYTLLLKKFPKDSLRQALGAVRYMLYVCFSNMSLLKAWLRLHKI